VDVSQQLISNEEDVNNSDYEIRDNEDQDISEKENISEILARKKTLKKIRMMKKKG